MKQVSVHKYCLVCPSECQPTLSNKTRSLRRRVRIKPSSWNLPVLEHVEPILALHFLQPGPHFFLVMFFSSSQAYTSLVKNLHSSRCSLGGVFLWCPQAPRHTRHLLALYGLPSQIVWSSVTQTECPVFADESSYCTRLLLTHLDKRRNHLQRGTHWFTYWLDYSPTLCSLSMVLNESHCRSGHLRTDR